jgi:hypothetical protein
VSARTRELDQKCRQLQLRCAMQRQHFANEARRIEQGFQSVDRIAGAALRVMREPLVIVTLIAGAIMIGPSRILRTLSRGLLLVAAAQRLWRLRRVGR